MDIVRSTGDWEVEVGTQVRALRMLANLTQAELARRANIAVGAVAGLEHGRGSTLRTLIAVTRALGQTSWLEQLAPHPMVSPIQQLRDQKRNSPRQRVYSPRRQAT
jgi:transcriptional regulator with XRE-family HTH domain